MYIIFQVEDTEEETKRTGITKTPSEPYKFFSVNDCSRGKSKLSFQ